MPARRREGGRDIVVGQFVIFTNDHLGDLEERACLSESDCCLSAVTLLGPARLRGHCGPTS